MEQSTGTASAETVTVTAVEGGAGVEAAKSSPDLSANIDSTQPTETKTLEAPAQTPEAELAAARFAALSRQEKKLKEHARNLKAKEAELEARIKAMEAGYQDSSKYVSVEELLKNPYAVTKKHGVTLESLAELAMNDGKLTPEKIVEQVESKFTAKIKELEDRLAEKESKEQQDRYDQTLQTFKANLTKHVNDTPDYEMIRATDSVDLVFDVINTDYETKLAAFIEENDREPTHDERNSFILSNKHASDMVEQWLLDQEKARIAKYRELNKTKGMFETPKPKPEQVKAQTQTLTNTLAAQVPSKDGKMLTEEESKKEAAKLIRFVE